jgi:hypothetical protein
MREIKIKFVVQDIGKCPKILGTECRLGNIFDKIGFFKPQSAEEVCEKRKIPENSTL